MPERVAAARAPKSIRRLDRRGFELASRSRRLRALAPSVTPRPEPSTRAAAAAWAGDAAGVPRTVRTAWPAAMNWPLSRPVSVKSLDTDPPRRSARDAAANTGPAGVSESAPRMTLPTVDPGPSLSRRVIVGVWHARRTAGHVHQGVGGVNGAVPVPVQGQRGSRRRLAEMLSAP